MNNRIIKYNFKPGLPQEFEILDMAQLHEEFSDELKIPHRTEFYQILWFQKGTHTHLVDFKSIEIIPNTLLFVNKNSVQSFNVKADFKGKIILFTDSFFCKTEADTKFLRNTILFNDLISISQISISGLNSVFKTVFRQLEMELDNSKDDYQSDILRNQLKNLLLHSERVRRKQDFIRIEKDADLDYALFLKRLLDDHYVAHKKVSFYCDKMNLTSKRLNKATTKIFGKTPKEIINDRVLLAAKRLLAHTNNSIKEIAFSLGFEEPTNFIKYFKKYTSKTPVEFRAEFTSA